MPKASITVVASGWITAWVNEQPMQTEGTAYNPQFGLEFNLASDTDSSPHFDLRPLAEYLLFDELGNSLGTIMDVTTRFVCRVARVRADVGYSNPHV
jgi:hypothetical protein